MRLGAVLGPIAEPHNPRWTAEQAARLAGEGFESLWSLQAVGRGFAFPDPFVTLAAAAAVTDDVELGTAIVQAPLYQVGDLAHRALSLRQLCGERFILGLGAGSTAADFQAFGQHYEQRFKRFNALLPQLRESLQSGAIDGLALAPSPAAAGGPPLLLGSWGKGVRRAAREFDGWIASALYRSPAQVVAALREYRAHGGGRAVVSSIQVPPNADLGQLKDTLAGFADAGFDDAVVILAPGAPPPAAIRGLVG